MCIFAEEYTSVDEVLVAEVEGLGWKSIFFRVDVERLTKIHLTKQSLPSYVISFSLFIIHQLIN